MIIALAVLLALLATAPPAVFAQANIRPLRTILEVEPINSNEGLGSGMKGIGDINHDGWPDIAVSAGAINKTLIYFGGPGTLDSTADVTLKGGGWIETGDLNGDGLMDMVVQTRYDTLLVYFGTATGPLAIDTIPDLILAAETLPDYFGQHFAIGDLNNDGFDDLVVAAPGYGQSNGKIYVYMGRSQPGKIPSFTAIGDTVESAYGFCVKIGDIDGDGIKDLVIGTYEYRRGNKTLDIYRGRTDWTFNKNSYSQRLDTNAVAHFDLDHVNLLDANLDGKADLSMTSNGRIYIYYGRVDSIGHDPDLTLTNPDTSFYRAMVGPATQIGDINGDENKDFVAVAWPGGTAFCILVYLGSAHPSPMPVAGRCIGFAEVAFDEIASVGDINGDGVEDFAGSAPLNPIPETSQDGYFAIYSGDTSLVLGIKNPPNTLPVVTELQQNYPNPFNPQTIIEYSLPRRSFVSIKIFDSLGKEIISLVNREEEPGTHTTQWDGKNAVGTPVASGVYYYHLHGANALQTIALLLLR